MELKNKTTVKLDAEFCKREKYYTIEPNEGTYFVYITDFTDLYNSYWIKNILLNKYNMKEIEYEEGGIIFKYVINFPCVINDLLGCLLFFDCIKLLEDDGFNDIHPKIPSILPVYPAVFLGNKKVKKLENKNISI